MREITNIRWNYCSIRYNLKYIILIAFFYFGINNLKAQATLPVYNSDPTIAQTGWSYAGADNVSQNYDCTGSGTNVLRFNAVNETATIFFSSTATNVSFFMQANGNITDARTIIVEQSTDGVSYSILPIVATITQANFAAINTTYSFNYTLSSTARYVRFRMSVRAGNALFIDGIAIYNTTAPLCYCIPSGSTAATTYISNVTTTGGISNFNNTSTYTTGGWANYSSTLSASQYPNTAINFGVTIVGGTAGIGIWVDWNNDGDFIDGSENVYNSSAYQATGTTNGSFTVPNGQATGNYRMRVITDYSSTTPTPCVSSSGTRGEAEDYTFTVATPPACSGTPTAGTVTVSPTSGAPGSTYGVTASSYTTGTGLTYQWQYNDGLGWNNQGSATSSYAALTGLTAPAFGTVRQWQLLVTCTNSSQSASTAAPGIFTTTYCIPTSTNTSDYISNFSTTGGLTNISNLSSGLSGTGYGNFYNTISASQYAGSSLNFTETYVGGGHGLNIWVDLDQDGLFESTERLFTAASTATGFTGSITIPGGTAAGDYRMRVRAWYGSINPDPCTNISYGEAEDYKLTVVPLPACSGTPTAGTVTVSPTSGAPGSTYGVTASSYTTGTGLTYQWQYNDGLGWNNQGSATSSYAALTGLTAPAFGTVRQWRLLVTCTNAGGGSASTASPGTFTTTYCASTSSSSTVYISSFSTTLGSTNITNNSSGYSTNGYSNTAQTVTQIQSSSVNYSATIFNVAGAVSFGIFVDWNQDGDFADAGETAVSLGSPTQITENPSGSFTVPATALTGTTRMRVVVNYATGAVASCNTNITGETEDYLFAVTAASCVVPSALSATSVDITTATIDWDAPTSGPTPIDYQHHQLLCYNRLGCNYITTRQVQHQLVVQHQLLAV
jgi:hypothetical protein